MNDALPPPPEDRSGAVTVSKGTVRLFQAAAAVIILAGLGFLAFTLLDSRQTTLTGSIQAPECDGGYQIVNASVRVLDQGGNVVGAGTTSGDVPQDLPGNIDVDDTACHAEFEIDVKDAEFYQLIIGTHGGPTYTRAELEMADWHLELSL